MARNSDHIATLGPGTMEFLPKSGDARSNRRLVKSDRMLVRYGAKNEEIQSFHADTASTETHPSQVAQDEICKKKKKTATDIDRYQQQDAGHCHV